MKKNLRDASGVITVMVTLMLIPLLSFGTLIMEAGRYLSAKQVLADAQITASMSILANYNTYLYERFGIVAIDPDETIEKTKNTFLSELRYNSDNVDDASSSSKLYNLNSDVKFETIYNLSDYTVLKRQVLEYAKYSVPYTVISNKLDLDSLFEKLKSKITDNAVFNVIEKIIQSTATSVDVMDLAFTALGRVEYRTLDVLNFLSESNDREYTEDNYNTEDLRKEYIKKDSEINKGKLDKRSESDRYVSGRKGYIDAINAKVDYMNNNPDPAKSLAAARNINVSAGSADMTLLYKAAIKAFLEEEDNKPTEDNTNGKEINSRTTVTLNYSYNGYSGSYNLKEGTAQITAASVSKKQTITIKTAINNIEKNAGNSISNYADLEEFADDKKITKTKEKYLESYVSSLQSNSKSAAKTELVNTLTTLKSTYDREIGEKNQVISDKSAEYITDLETARDMFKLIAKSIEDKDKKIRKLVENDNGELVEGTEDSKYYEGATGRLKYAQETYENENKESENAAALGSNVEKVEANISEVVSDLNTRNNAANNAVSYINEIIRSVSSTNASQIKSYSHSNGEDKVNASITIGATCSKIASYASGDFKKIGDFAATPVVDVDGDEFDINKITGALGISDLWSAIKKLKDVLNFVPATYDESYVVTLNDSDYSLLPAMKDGSAYNKSDEAYVNQLLADVQKTLGDVFGDTVFSDKIVDQDMSAFQSTTASLFGSADGESTGDSSISNLNDKAEDNNDKGILKLVTILKEIIETIKSVFQSLKDLFGSFKELISGLGKTAYYTVLINTYITQKFPSRMNTVSEATTFTKKATSGSYFSGCCVEYCIFGSKSEKANQQSAFWMIFGIKAILNCIQILTDSTAMEIISACNIFAPLMFIAMLYMETNIDMNFLMRIGIKVPLWKDHLHLSAQGLKEIFENVLSQFVEITESGNGKRFHKPGCRTLARSESKGKLTIQQATQEGFTACKVCNPGTKDNDKIDGYVSLSYDNYLYVVMMFISSKTKLEHIADLIQLETRYYETKQGVSSNFRIDKTSTYVRSEVVASYNTLLPMFSLGSSGNGFAELKGLEYVGY